MSVCSCNYLFFVKPPNICWSFSRLGCSRSKFVDIFIILVPPLVEASHGPTVPGARGRPAVTHPTISHARLLTLETFLMHGSYLHSECSHSEGNKTVSRVVNNIVANVVSFANRPREFKKLPLVSN